MGRKRRLLIYHSWFCMVLSNWQTFRTAPTNFVWKRKLNKLRHGPFFWEIASTSLRLNVGINIWLQLAFSGCKGKSRIANIVVRLQHRKNVLRVSSAFFLNEIESFNASNENQQLMVPIKIEITTYLQDISAGIAYQSDHECTITFVFFSLSKLWAIT